MGDSIKIGKEYVIKTNEKYTPMPWSHILANENFGTIITSGGGGYTWSKNSRDNKITTWSNDPIEDNPSEVLFISNEKDVRIYSLPYETLENYELTFRIWICQMYI